MKIKIKHRNTKEVLFSHECENNTIKKTVLKAIENYVDLHNADLKYADLRNADLSNADLKYADLCNAYLSNADLSNADLRYADLSNASVCSAKLDNAYLSNADLSNADLRYAVGNSREIKTLQTSTWMIVMSKKYISIGCQQHEFKKWMKFTDNKISRMDNNALNFWKEWRKIIKKMHKLGFKK